MTIASPAEPLIDVGALAKAVGVGIVVCLLIACIVFSSMFLLAVLGFGTSMADLSTEALLMGTVGMLAVVFALLCIPLVAVVGIGASYALFYKRSHGSVTLDKGAIGGAATVDVLVIFSTIFNCAVLVLPIESLINPGQPGTTTGAINFSIAMTSTIAWLISGILIGSMLGAAGGGAYAAIAGKAAGGQPPAA